MRIASLFAPLAAAPLLALALPFALTLTACGDDAKVGGKGAPAAGPATGPASTPTASPSVPGAAATPPAMPASTPAMTPDAPTAQVGDWVAWEVRIAGSNLVTQLTWRALAVDGLRVRFLIASKTVDPKGTVVAKVETEEMRSAAEGPLPSGAPETIQAAGHDLATIRTQSAEGTVWRSRDVPLGGLVRSRAPGGVEQALVGFGRGGAGARAR